MNRSAGFTLVELIMTMIIIGIISAVAIPRFFDTDVFRARGFADQVQAALRYAQKVAIAQHRNVFVRLNGRIALCFDVNCTNYVLPPAGDNSGSNATLAACNNVRAWFCEAPPSGVTISSSPPAQDPFFFNPLGKPFNNGDTSPASTFAKQGISISIADVPMYTITVEPETGYVH